MKEQERDKEKQNKKWLDPKTVSALKWGALPMFILSGILVAMVHLLLDWLGNSVQNIRGPMLGTAMFLNSFISLIAFWMKRRDLNRIEEQTRYFEKMRDHYLVASKENAELRDLSLQEKLKLEQQRETYKTSYLKALEMKRVVDSNIVNEVVILCQDLAKVSPDQSWNKWAIETRRFFVRRLIELVREGGMTAEEFIDSFTNIKVIKDVVDERLGSDTAVILANRTKMPEWQWKILEHVNPPKPEKTTPPARGLKPQQPPDPCRTRRGSFLIS